MAAYWSLCAYVFGRSEQGENYAMVVSGLALWIAVVWPLVFDLNKFHLLWLVPLAVLLPKVAIVERFLRRNLRRPAIEVLPAALAVVAAYVAALSYATF